MAGSNDVNLPDDVHLILGRILMDQGFRDLFLHDPMRAGAALGVTLQPGSLACIQDRLARIDAMDASARRRFSSELNSLERWKQA